MEGLKVTLKTWNNFHEAVVIQYNFNIASSMRHTYCRVIEQSHKYLQGCGMSSTAVMLP